MATRYIALLVLVGCSNSVGDPGQQTKDSPHFPPIIPTPGDDPNDPTGPTGPTWLPPADRQIDWANSVGVSGGIPVRTVERDCVVEFGAHADGSDSSGAINRCLQSIEDGEVAYLPPGTYVIGAQIDIPAQRTLRGAGMEDTVLLAKDALYSDVRIGTDYTDTNYTQAYPIAGGTTAGSKTLELTNANGISAGDHLYVSELNDPSIPVDPVGTGGRCNWCGLYGYDGDRARVQIAQVASKAGSTLTLESAMYFNFSPDRAPLVHVTPEYVEYAGVEDLTIENGGSSTDEYRTNVMIQGAANSWVRGVKLSRCGDRCVDIWFDGYRNEIRDSLLTDCVDHENSDSCYGVQIEASSGNLIENNVFDQTSTGVLLVSGSGNVAAYNYLHAVHRTQDQADWFWPSEWAHGSHSSYNLWEGNEIVALEWDSYWGSNSHNTAFRNRMYGFDETIDYDLPNLMEIGAMITGEGDHYMTEAGNVLGTSGFHDTYELRNEEYWMDRAIWATGVFGRDDEAFNTTLRHQNWDSVTGSTHHCADPGEPGCQGGSEESALPASLFHTSRPDFFAACEAWPPIGPDVPDGITPDHIPAWRRFTGAPDPVCP